MIAVIIPVYNDVSNLNKLLNDLDNQTYKIFDTYIAVDGDSKNRYEYEGLAILHDAKCLYFDKNEGAGQTRQRALDVIYNMHKYDYVSFADSDDRVYARYIECLVKAKNEKDYDLIVSNILKEFDDNTTFLLNSTNANHRTMSWCNGKLYKLDFLYDNNIRFREDLRINEDIYFNSIAFNMTNNIKLVNETNYLWRWNKNSTTHKEKTKEELKYHLSQAILAHTYTIIDLAKLKNNELNVTTVSSRLINIYNISMEAIYLGFKLSDFKQEYDLFIDQIDVIDFVNNNIELFLSKLNQVGEYNYSKLYYYKYSFIDFINKAYNNTKR